MPQNLEDRQIILLDLTLVQFVQKGPSLTNTQVGTWLLISLNHAAEFRGQNPSFY
jgi:hypothetical protein